MTANLQKLYAHLKKLKNTHHCLGISIKKIFIANGFSNNFILSKINESDIESTEQID